MRSTAGVPCNVTVVAEAPNEAVGMYMLRQYLRGHIAACEFDGGATPDGHCHLDRTFHLARAEYVVRIDDALSFQPGWLERALGAFQKDPDLGCLSLVEPPPEKRPRGRPRKPTGEPGIVDHISNRCFVTRRSLFVRHECELMGEQPGGLCVYQQYLKRINRKLAYLPGLVGEIELVAPVTPEVAALEDELPPHESETGAMHHLEQAFDLGDDVLLTCMACGETELEVLAARIKFCSAHRAAIGFMYELRCPECGELHYKDDLQFSCPDVT